MVPCLRVRPVSCQPYLHFPWTLARVGPIIDLMDCGIYLLFQGEDLRETLSTLLLAWGHLDQGFMATLHCPQDQPNSWKVARTDGYTVLAEWNQLLPGPLGAMGCHATTSERIYLSSLRSFSWARHTARGRNHRGSYR